jgi:hypothetical protein
MAASVVEDQVELFPPQVAEALEGPLPKARQVSPEVPGHSTPASTAAGLPYETLVLMPSSKVTLWVVSAVTLTGSEYVSDVFPLVSTKGGLPL